MSGYAKDCFGYKLVMPHSMTTSNRTKFRILRNGLYIKNEWTN
jgi:hypothetical protein